MTIITFFFIILFFHQFVYNNSFVINPTQKHHHPITKNKNRRRSSSSSSSSSTTSLGVSEFHIPAYKGSKIPFIIYDEDLIVEDDGSNYGGVGVLTKLREETYTSNDYTSLIPYQDGHLLHKTNKQILSSSECQSIIQEVEQVASQRGWTRNRHGNFPTIDIPLKDLSPSRVKFIRQTLYQKLYPLLRTQFKEFIDSPDSLQVVDGFIVKYDAESGHADLKPHRDGSVFSMNIALNPSSEFEGGGTWFNSLNDAIKIEEGEVVTHASGLLHGGQAITSGKRYILVAFVVLKGYHAWSMRFYNQIRHL